LAGALGSVPALLFEIMKKAKDLTTDEKVYIVSMEVTKLLIAVMRDCKLKDHITLTSKESNEIYHLYFTRIKNYDI